MLVDHATADSFRAPSPWRASADGLSPRPQARRRHWPAASPVIGPQPRLFLRRYPSSAEQLLALQTGRYIGFGHFPDLGVQILVVRLLFNCRFVFFGHTLTRCKYFSPLLIRQDRRACHQDSEGGGRGRRGGFRGESWGRARSAHDDIEGVRFECFLLSGGILGHRRHRRHRCETLSCARLNGCSGQFWSMPLALPSVRF